MNFESCLSEGKAKKVVIDKIREAIVKIPKIVRELERHAKIN